MRGALACFAVSLMLAAPAGAQSSRGAASTSSQPINYFAFPETPSRSSSPNCPDARSGTLDPVFDDIGCYSSLTYSMPTEGSWLQMRITPSFARVYVNGGFAGYVQQFTAPYRGVRLGEGPQFIEIWAPGYKRQSFWMTQDREKTSTLSGTLPADKKKDKKNEPRKP